MADPVRPDPATRDHIAHHLYVSTYCLHTVHGDCRLTCKVCSAVCLCTCHTAPSPLPDEPPPGVYDGHGGDIWQRAKGAPSGNEWWCMGESNPMPWYEAYERGADPGRRLVELPDPDEEYALDDIRRRTAIIMSCGPGDWVSATVRALAERGNQ